LKAEPTFSQERNELKNALNNGKQKQNREREGEGFKNKRVLFYSIPNFTKKAHSFVLSTGVLI